MASLEHERPGQGASGDEPLDTKLTVVRYQDRAVSPIRATRSVPENVASTAKFCSVFVEANALGWLLFPPFDAEVSWEDGSFRVDTDDSILEYVWRGRMRELIGYASNWWCSKIPGVLQIDVGLTLRTTATQKLLLTGVRNRPNQAYWTHEGLLDSDWFHVPSTVNLQTLHEKTRFSIRRDWPIAQVCLISGDSLQIKAYELEDISIGHPSLKQWREYIAEAYGPSLDEHSELTRQKIGFYRKLKRSTETGA